MTLDAPEEDYLTLLPIGACLIALFAFPNSPELRGMIDFHNMPKKERPLYCLFTRRTFKGTFMSQIKIEYFFQKMLHFAHG